VEKYWTKSAERVEDVVVVNESATDKDRINHRKWKVIKGYLKPCFNCLKSVPFSLAFDGVLHRQITHYSSSDAMKASIARQKGALNLG
jgi:hypothetical protein